MRTNPTRPHLMQGVSSMSAHRRLFGVFATTQFYRRTFRSFTPDVTAPRAFEPPQLTTVVGVGQAGRGPLTGGAGGKLSPVGFRPESNHDRLSQHPAQPFSQQLRQEGLKALPYPIWVSECCIVIPAKLIAGLCTKCAHTTCTETSGADSFFRSPEGNWILFAGISGSRVIGDDLA